MPVGAAPEGPAPDSSEIPEAGKRPKKTKRGAAGAAKGAGTEKHHGAGGWGQVDVQDDFFVGLEEGGFMGLEVLSEPVTESTAGGISLTPAAAQQPPGGKETKKAKKQAKAKGALSAEPSETAVSARDSASTGAAAASEQPTTRKQQMQNDKSVVSTAAEPITEQQTTQGEAAGQPLGEKPSRKRKRRGDEGAAATGADQEGAGNSGSAGNTRSAANNGEAKLQQRAEKVAAMAARLQASREAMVERLNRAKVAAAEVKAAIKEPEFELPPGASPQYAKALRKKARLGAKKDALQTLRELQKAKRALKKAQKQSKAIRRSRYKLKQEEKEAAAAAARGEVYVPMGKKGRVARGNEPAVVLPHHLNVALEALAAADMGAWAGHGLHPPLLAALAAQGFTTPTPVQEACLPAAIHGRRDIIGAAQTGSGKTLAFGIPIVQSLLHERARLLRGEGGGDGDGGGSSLDIGDPQDRAAMAALTSPDSGPLRALVLCPTRELAMQVCQHIQAIGRPCGVWAAAVVGGLSPLKQERQLAKAPAVVVATPGRLWDLMQNGAGSASHLMALEDLTHLVIDEADRMVQPGHFEELFNVLDLVAAAKAAAAAPTAEPEAHGAEADEDGGPGGDGSDDDGGEAEQAQELEPAAVGAAAGGLQTFVFSATLTLPLALRRRLQKRSGGSTGSATLESLMDRVPFHNRPKAVDLTTETKLPDRITETQLLCGEDERDEALYCLLAAHPGRTIVFANAVSTIRRVAAILQQLGIPAAPLHASMQQRQRLKSLDRFKSSPNGVLVATDVAARGLDVKGVACVIHYQIPPAVDVYVHRAGRTARAEADGLSIALVSPAEAPRFRALMAALQRPPPPEYPLEAGVMAECRRRVRLAVRADQLSRSSNRDAAERVWRRRQAEELGIELSDDDGASEDVELPGQDGPIADMSKAVHRRAARRKERVRRLDVDRVAGESLKNLKEELAQLTAEPLRPRFSAKFFTGGASGAAAYMPNSSGDGAQAVGMKAVVSMAQQVQHGRTAGGSGAGSSNQQPSAHHQQSNGGVAPSNSKHPMGVANGGVQKPKKGKKAKKLSAKQQQSIALAAALEAKARKKLKKRSRSVVVAPQTRGA